jgi:AraC-like DNA-binding protein
MLAPPNHSGTMLFSSRQVPERDSFAVWTRLLNKWLFSARGNPIGEGPFPVSVRLRVLSDIRFGWGTVGASRYRRTRDIVAGDNDDLVLFLNLAGSFSACHGTREIALSPGDGYVMACSELGSHVRPTAGELLCLRVRRNAVQPLVRNLDDKLGRALPGGDESLRMLSRYLRLMDESQTMANETVQSLATKHVHDLFAAALGATREGRESAQAGALRAARLGTAKTIVEAHLADADLSAEFVARHLRISPRSVQRLFETDGTTFSGFVVNVRLTKAYAVLTDPRASRSSIGEIALDCGFGDISYFNRKFRARYNASPSEVRFGEALAARRAK